MGHPLTIEAPILVIATGPPAAHCKVLDLDRRHDLRSCASRGGYERGHDDAQACGRICSVQGSAHRRAAPRAGLPARGDRLTYLGDDDVRYYKDVAEEIDYPALDCPTPAELSFSEEPHTVNNQERDEPWDMTIEEAVQLALQNSEIVRSAGQFLVPGNSLFTSADRNPSVFDPAIQETGVLFGGRGVEAALSEFDANFTTRMVWGRDEAIQNNVFFGGGLNPGGTLVRQSGNFDASLGKIFANGGQIQLGHRVSYQRVNIPGQLFPSTYTGNVEASYRQPLLAGAGVEYTRIAGPIAASFGGLSGVTQGVVIARINNDITIANFEAAVINLTKDAQDTYWDLYLAYRNFDTAVAARNAALATWRKANITGKIGGARDFQPTDESQALDQYFAAQALVDTARSNIYTTETRLRRLLGLPVNDGRIIRPANEPITAEIVPDWYISLAEALTNRVELRQQKWNIKSLQLQLKAAHSLTRPRLDLIARYGINGFGDQLIGYDDDDSAGTAQGLDNFYETLTQGNQTGWNLGLEMTVPIGLRSAHAQVRNIELRLVKANKLLETQELEIGQELAVAFQELARAYTAAKSQYSRRLAAIENARVYDVQVIAGSKTIDETLRSQERRARAEVDFYTSLVEYNKALTNLQFRKGTLLAATNVQLLEGGWNPDAYVDAYRRAQARSEALNAPFLHTEPPEFAVDHPVGGVEYMQPGAAEPNPFPAGEPPLTAPQNDVPPAPAQEPTPAESTSGEPYAPPLPMPTEESDGHVTAVPFPDPAVPKFRGLLPASFRAMNRAGDDVRTATPIGEWQSE